MQNARDVTTCDDHFLSITCMQQGGTFSTSYIAVLCQKHGGGIEVGICFFRGEDCSVFVDICKCSCVLFKYFCPISVNFVTKDKKYS